MKETAGPYMTVGQWVGTFFISSIPIVGLIANLVWLFGGGKRQERTNYVRASLIWSVVLTVLSGIAVAIAIFAFEVSIEQFFSDLSTSINESIAA